MKTLFVILTFSFSPLLWATPLRVDQYLEQVSSTNPGLKSAKMNVEGEGLQAQAASALTSPFLFGNYTNYDDYQETAMPAASGDRTHSKQYTVGLGMNSPIGLNAKYSFNQGHTKIYHATMVPVPDYRTAYNKIELTQSLGRNGFGSETRAQKDALETAHLAQHYGSRYQALALLVSAENTYWRLALARKAVVMQKEVLDRSHKMLQWATRRVNMQLGDKADLLQAQATYDLRRLELAAAQEEERNAARAFNLLRQEVGEKVNEELVLPSLEETLHLAEPIKVGTRFDLRAAEYQEKATIASLQLDKEKLKPTFDLFTNLSWTGRDVIQREATNEAFTAKRKILSYGLNFSVPLVIPSLLDGLKGANLSQEAATFALEQKRLEENLEWTKTQSQLQDARTRLKLLSNIEAVQKEKSEHEQGRLLRGRTTTYQALIFEQDYSSTQLSRIRTQGEVLQLLAQMKLFRGDM